MRADAIASKGRVGLVEARGISTSGILSRLVGLIEAIKSAIHAFLDGLGYIKIFKSVTEMDRVFSRGTSIRGTKE